MPTNTITRAVTILAVLGALLLGGASGCKTRTEWVRVAPSVAEYDGDMLDVQLPSDAAMAGANSGPVLVQVRRTGVDWDAIGDASLVTLKVIGVAAWYTLEIIAHCCVCWAR